MGIPYKHCLCCNTQSLLFFTFTLRVAPCCLIELVSTSSLQVPCDFSSWHGKAGSCQEHLDLYISWRSNVQFSGGVEVSLFYFLSYTHEIISLDERQNQAVNYASLKEFIKKVNSVSAAALQNDGMQFLKQIQCFRQALYLFCWCFYSELDKI